MPTKKTSVKSKSTRLISLLLAIVLVATMVPALAFATGDEEPVNPESTQGAEEGTNGADDLEGDNASEEGETTGGLDNSESNTDTKDASSEMNINSNDVAEQEQSLLNTLADETTTELSPQSTATDFTQLYTELNTQSVQTFYDMTHKTTSTDAQLTVTLQVQPTDKYVSGGRIELPLDYNPAYQTTANKGIADFNYGTSGSNGLDDAEATPDFFFLDETKLANAIALNTSIVESYDLKTKPGTLILNLKSAEDYKTASGGTIVGLKSLQLNFDFNDAYDMKVPVGATMWQPQPTVYADADTNGMSATPKAIKTSASHEPTVKMIRRDPADANFLGGGLTTRFIHNNLYYYESDFDTSKGVVNRVWVEVPEGTVFNSENVTTKLFPDGSSTANGYTRYYKNVKNEEKYWNQWHNSGNPYNTFNQHDLIMVVPDIDTGKTFELRLGVDYQKINGVDKTVSEPISYTKQDRAVWAPYVPSAHGTGGSTQVVCGIENNNISQTFSYAPMVNWGNNALKNLGSGSITGTTYQLYQDETTSAKVNFNQVTLYALRDTSDPNVVNPWSQYRYEVYVTQVGGATTLATQGTFAPMATGNNAAVDLTLPSLGAGQYISTIKVIPTGVKGGTDGEWVSMNGFALRYTAQAWDNKTWPDGTAVPTTQTVASLYWDITYNNNPKAPGAYPENNEGVTPITTKPIQGKVYYSSQPYAQANMVSAVATKGVNPGDTVTYELYGYNNGLNTVGLWANPQITIRVPKVMKLDTSKSFTLNDLSNSGGKPSINVSSVEEVGNYSYYTFTVTGYSAKELSGQNQVFSIPLSFAVDSAAAPRLYEAPQVVVTSANPSTFWGSYNLPMDGKLGADLSNYGLKEGDHYSISSIASSALHVLSLPGLDAGSGVLSSVTGGAYVTNEVVPAAHGETTSMKLTITNSGNVDFTNVRLYNILPYNEDEQGSSGSITFEGLTVEGIAPIVYYSDDKPEDLPLYGNHGTALAGENGAKDLQVSTFQEAWDQAAPATGTTAFFLDFGTYVLKPNEKIEIILNFKVPGQDQGDQTALNQFAYSAQEVNSSAAPLNQVPSKQGFSTASMGILYNPKLPAVYDTGGKLEGKGTIEDMPGDNTASFTKTGDSLDVSNTSPALVGFKFMGWDTSSNTSTVVYAPGAKISFSEAGTVILYPVWQIQKYTVSYSYTNTAPNMPALPKDSQIVFAEDVTVVGKPQLAGYSFNGWVVKSGGVSAATGSFVMPGNSVELEGTWEANTNTPYTIEHYKVNSKNVATIVAEDTETPKGTTDTTSPDAQPKNYEGYSYSSGYDYGNNKEVLNGTITADGKLVLKLYYTIHVNNVTYEYTGDVPADAPSLAVYQASNVEYGTAMTVAPKPSATGYTFTGWNVSGVTPTGTSYSMPDGPVAFTGSWSADVYNLSYNLNGGSGNVPAGHSIAFDEEFTVAKATGISRQGYQFAGWNTQANGGGIAFSEGQEATSAFTSNVTLYAQWDPIGVAYTVQHYLVDANNNASLNFSETRSGITGSTVSASQRSYAPTHYFNAGYPGTVTSGTVQADGSLILRLYYPINIYTVTFVDWNGTVIASRTGVPYGGAALAPANPIRIGYTFQGWDKAFNNVTSNLTVNARYTIIPIATYTVTFVDWDGSVLSSQTVTRGGSATAPANPTRTGYTFTGWDRGYTNVTSNITVTAQYTPVETFTITFVDYDGTVLQTSTVERGGSATPPANPTREGFRFTGWDKSSSAWTNVTADATIRATYDDETTETPITTVTETIEGGTGGTPAEVIALAAEEQGIPNIGVPLAAPAGFAAWALANLILVILGVVMALVFSVIRGLRKEDDEDDEEREAERRARVAQFEQTGTAEAGEDEPLRRRRSIGWLIASIILAVLGAVIFILTQDISLPMVWVDMWTIVNAILFIGVLIVGNVAVRRKKKARKEDDSTAAQTA